MKPRDYHRQEATKRATKYAALTPNDRKTTYGQQLATEARHHAQQLNPRDKTRQNVLTTVNAAEEEASFIQESTTKEERGLSSLASPQEILSSGSATVSTEDSSVPEG